MLFENLHDLIIYDLQDLYKSETQYLKILPKLIETAHSEDLKQAFHNLLEETNNQISRLDETFNYLEVSKETNQPSAIDNLLKVLNTILDNHNKTALFDAALIGIIQKIQHYQIAGYGTTRTYAKHLDLEEVMDLLQDSLNEAANIDKKLTKIAEGSFLSSGINQEALEVISLSKQEKDGSKSNLITS